ncbi:MAG: type I-E CRISPR-associated endoribonuclease Cas2e [Megasphaera sp.]|uniref:type I-E CRISPR-associated endoribonuclease Cas2e n=1 Tax=Megasphaera sp. TaxID=2023260 RepID=UPI0025C19803|nr:type I-E CRISPR-associated endoribonuclease Cas2e [Megasphaera sp.]MCI7599443.1 type I-E CRISPR-associated endoribonuclease Cas2e [Megasphaera sp.]
MVVLVIDNGSEKLRGELTRWLMEVKPGVLAGNVSAMVREKLWNKVKQDSERRGAVLLYSMNTEQGFAMKMCGEPKRQIVDFDGVQLIEVRNDL